MAQREDLREALEFHKAALKSAREAYLALLNGQVQSYSIGSRNLTRLDLTKLNEEIADHEKKIKELDAQLNGGSIRKAVGVVPRDW